MATGQVLFQRFFYTKSFVKHSMEVGFSLFYQRNGLGGNLACCAHLLSELNTVLQTLYRSPWRLSLYLLFAPNSF